MSQTAYLPVEMQFLKWCHYANKRYKPILWYIMDMFPSFPCTFVKMSHLYDFPSSNETWNILTGPFCGWIHWNLHPTRNFLHPLYIFFQPSWIKHTI